MDLNWCLCGVKSQKDSIYCSIACQMLDEEEEEDEKEVYPPPSIHVVIAPTATSFNSLRRLGHRRNSSMSATPATSSTPPILPQQQDFSNSASSSSINGSAAGSRRGSLAALSDDGGGSTIAPPGTLTPPLSVSRRPSFSISTNGLSTSTELFGPGYHQTAPAIVSIQPYFSPVPQIAAAAATPLLRTSTPVGDNKLGDTTTIVTSSSSLSSTFSPSSFTAPPRLMASIINSYKEDDVGAGSNCNEMQIDDCSESGHGDEDVNRHRFESTSSYTLPYRKPLPGTICSNTELNMNGELYGFDLHHTVGKNINTSSRPNVVLGHKRSLSSSSATFSSVKDSHVNIPPSNTNDRVSSSSNMSCTSTMSSCSSSSTSSSPFKKQNLSSMDHIQQNETQLQPPIVSLSSHRTSNSSSSSSDDENIHTFFSVPHTSRSYQNITNSNTNTTSSSNSYVKSVAVATNRTRSQSFHHGFKSTSTNSAPLTRYIHVTAPLFTSTSSCSQPIVIASSNMNNQINVTRDSISSSSSSSSPTSSPVSFSPNRQRGRQRAYTIHSNSISNNASHHYQHIGVDIPATSSSSTSPPFTRTHNDLSTIGIAIELLDRRRRSRSFGSGSNSSSSSGGGRTMRSHSASLMKQTSSPPRI